ncbi:MAG: hypothetical protein ACQERT_05275 [Thermodesulfobacteriota bacterium]
MSPSGIFVFLWARDIWIKYSTYHVISRTARGGYPQVVEIISTIRYE